MPVWAAVPPSSPPQLRSLPGTVSTAARSRALLPSRPLRDGGAGAVLGPAGRRGGMWGGCGALPPPWHRGAAAGAAAARRGWRWSRLSPGTRLGFRIVFHVCHIAWETSSARYNFEQKGKRKKPKPFHLILRLLENIAWQVPLKI